MQTVVNIGAEGHAGGVRRRHGDVDHGTQYLTHGKDRSGECLLSPCWPGGLEPCVKRG